MKLLLQVKDRSDAWNTVGTKDQVGNSELEQVVARAELLEMRNKWINSGYFVPETKFRVIVGGQS